MHRPPQLPPFGDVVVGERARAAFGEEVRVVEVYHRDGKDAGAWVGVVGGQLCLMGVWMEDGGVLMWEEKGSQPSMVLISPPMFFISRSSCPLQLTAPPS